jgi:hypothetical protein
LINENSVVSKLVFPVALQAGAEVAVGGADVWVGEAVGDGAGGVPSGVWVAVQVGVGVSSGDVSVGLGVGVPVRVEVEVEVRVGVRVDVEV